MISQTSPDTGLNGEALNLAAAANRTTPGGAAENGADGALIQLSQAVATPVAQPSPAVPEAPVIEAAVQTAVPKTPADKTPVSKTQLVADAQKLEAHVERRQRLAERLRAENPARSDEEIEELLEQFGA
jgi:hypothetical protein